MGAISWFSTLAASCEVEEPSGRIRCRGRQEHRDALIHDGENASTERRLAVWVAGDRSLEQENREPACPAQPSDLAPEPSARDGRCEIDECLSLDQRPKADVVVSDSERRDRHRGSELHELLRNATALLENVNDDRRTPHHAVRVADLGRSTKVAFLAFSGTEKA